MYEKRTGRSGRASSGDFAESVIPCAHGRSRLEKEAAIYRERKYPPQRTKANGRALADAAVSFSTNEASAYLPPPPSASGAGSSALGSSAGEGAASTFASAAASDTPAAASGVASGSFEGSVVGSPF